MWSLCVFCSDGWWREVAHTTAGVRAFLRRRHRGQYSLHRKGQPPIRIGIDREGRIYRHSF